MHRWKIHVIGGLGLLGLSAAALAAPAAGVAGPELRRTEPALTLTHTQLNGVDALSTDDVWAVGRTPSLDVGIVEHWDGLSWTRTRLHCRCELGAVAAISASDVWAIGDGHQPVLEHWDGTGWTASAAPELRNATLVAVSASSSDDVWAVGRYKPGLRYRTLVLHWDGSAWTTVPLVPGGQEPGSHFLTGVVASSATDVVAVGWVQGHALLYHWDGTAWTRSTDLDAGVAAHAVSGTSDHDAWAVGAGGVGNLTAHWDGSAWTAVKNPRLGFSTDLQAVTSVTPDDVWAAGYANHGQILRTLAEHWDGSAWSRVTSPNPFPRKNNSITGISAASATDGWAVGVSYADGFHVRQSFILHWDGTSWTG